MTPRNPTSTAQVAGHPIHPMLIPFPIAFLVATLVSDLIFFANGQFGMGDCFALSAWCRARKGSACGRCRPY